MINIKRTIHRKLAAHCRRSGRKLGAFAEKAIEEALAKEAR